MEFDSNSRDPSQEISNAERLAASTKRLTIAPIHEITDDEPVIVPREDIDSSIPMTNSMVYIASESEDTVEASSAQVIQPEPPKTEGTSLRKISIIFGAVITALAIIGMAIFLQQP